MGAFIGQASDQALRRSLTLLKNVLVLDKDARAKVGEREWPPELECPTN